MAKEGPHAERGGPPMRSHGPAGWHTLGFARPIQTRPMRSILPFTLLALTTIPLHAQERSRPMTLSLFGHLGDPLGEFDQAWGKEFVGLGANFSVPMKRMPFETGFQFDWSHMGGESAVVPIDEEFIDATEADMQVNSNIYGFHALARLKPFSSKVAPYVDGLGGWRTFSTRTKLKVDGLEDPLMNERNEVDAAWSWGWAAGVMVGLGGTMMIEGRFERLQGGEVTYVDPSSVSIDADGNLSYGTLTSNSDAWMIKLGFGFRF